MKNKKEVCNCCTNNCNFEKEYGGISFLKAQMSTIFQVLAAYNLMSPEQIQELVTREMEYFENIKESNNETVI